MEALKNSVSSEVAALQNTNIRQDGAVEGAGTSTYVRWGNFACPSSAEHVYSGTVAGGNWSSAGSTSSVLCLHHKPVFGQVIHPNYIGRISGAEYSTYPGPHSNIDPLCVVCSVPRPTTITVPGTTCVKTGGPWSTAVSLWVAKTRTRPTTNLCASTPSSLAGTAARRTRTACFCILCTPTAAVVPVLPTAASECSPAPFVPNELFLYIRTYC